MRPRSVEGRAFVEAGHSLAQQSRATMGGFGGLDAVACLELLAARGIDRTIAALLVPYWEAGMMKAAEARREESGK